MYMYNSLEAPTSLRRDFKEHSNSRLGNKNLQELELTSIVNVACNFG
jgi:hypothetical protein